MESLCKPHQHIDRSLAVKLFGRILLYAGLFVFFAAGSWLKVVFAWWSAAATLCLMGVGAAIAGIGGFMLKHKSSGL